MSNSSFKNEQINTLLKNNDAKIISLESEFITLQKTGSTAEIKKLFTYLKPYGVLEYAKSGRVAVSRPMRDLKDFI